MATGRGGCGQHDRGHAACTIAAIPIIEKCSYSVNTLFETIFLSFFLDKAPRLI
jgi:hypothetical protein